MNPVKVRNVEHRRQEQREDLCSDRRCHKRRDLEGSGDDHLHYRRRTSSSGV